MDGALMTFSLRRAAVFALVLMFMPLHNSQVAIGTDVFQNSITDEQTNLINKISGVCDGKPTIAKNVRINDSILKNTEIYLLWSFTCDTTSAGTSSIMISIKKAGTWSTHIVALNRKFYVDPNYLGAPNLIDLNASGLGIVWVDHLGDSGKPKLLGKIFDGVDPTTIANLPITEIATSTNCNIGNILPFSNSFGSQITFLTNNGGSASCEGDIYSTQLIAGQWSTPVPVSQNQQVNDLYAKSNLAVDANGVSYLCYVTSVSHPSTSNKVAVIALNNGVSSEVYSRSYSDIRENSAHYCDLKLDQNDKPHLLVAEVAWSVSGTGRSAKPETTRFQEVVKNSDSWEIIPDSLQIVNSDLDGSWVSTYFCKQCNSKLNLIVTSESNKIRIYELGTNGTWSKVRDFNEGYDQDIDNIQEVWGNSAAGYTFIITNFAEEAEGPFTYQKGHYSDLRPTFSPPGVNKLLFSDSVLDVASVIYREEFTTINTRLTSRGLLKVGNSIISMWEDLGSAGIPPGIILIERLVKENPNCVAAGYAPGRPQSLTATSSYTTAILNFESSVCGTAPTQAVVEVKNVSSGTTEQIVINNPPSSLQVPNLQVGNSYSFRVKFSNTNGTSKFTSFSNSIVSSGRPVSQIPQIPNQPIEEPTEKQKVESTQVPPQNNSINLVKFQDSTISKLKTLGISLLVSSESNLSDSPSKILVGAFSNLSKVKAFNISSEKFVEISLNVSSKERIKIQLTKGRKTINLGSAMPTEGSRVNLPAMKIRPGNYVIVLTSSSGKKGFTGLRSK
jgi:hypothetical protein